MHSARTRPPEPHRPEFVGALYRRTPVPQIPTTTAMRVAVVVSIGILLLVLVLAVLS
jgi:hypothetical protein